MSVLRTDGTNDSVILDAPPTTTGAFTVYGRARRPVQDTSGWHTLVSIENSAGSVVLAVFITGSGGVGTGLMNRLWLDVPGAGADRMVVTIPVDTDFTWFVGKTATGIARFSVKLGASAIQHANGELGGAFNAAGSAAGGTIVLGEYEGGDDANMWQAVVGFIAGTNLSDADRATLAGSLDLASWEGFSVAPTRLIRCNALPVIDETGNSTQTSTTGDPALEAISSDLGFDFGGGTSVVGASLRQPSVLRTLRSASARQPWTLRTLRGASGRQPFSVIAFTGASLRQRLTVRTIIGSSLRQPATLRILAGASLRQPANVHGAVGSSLRQRYGVVGTVGGSLRQPELVLTIAGGSLRQPYLAAQPGVALGPWLPLLLSTSLTTVGGSLRQPTRILTVLGQSARQPYVVRVVTGSGVRQSYALLTLRGASSRQPLLLRTVNGEILRQSYTVEQVGIVGGTLRQSYTLRIVQGASTRQPMRVLVTVSSDARQTYTIAGLLTVSGGGVRQPYRVGVMVFAAGRIGRLHRPRTGRAAKIGVVP